MNHQLTLQLQEKETSQLQFNRNQILSESLEQKQLQKKRDEEFRILLNQVDVMQREISDLNDRIEQEDTHWKEQKQLTNSAFELIHEMKLENDALRARLAQRETKDETVQPTRTPAKPSRPLLTNLSPPDSPHTHRSPLSHERQPMFRDTHQGQDQVTDPLHDVTPTEVSTSQPPLVTSEIPYTTFPNHSSKPNINMSDLSYLVGASTPHRTTTHPHENIDSDSDYEEISEYEEIEEEISETDDDSLPPQHSSFRQSPIHTISASPFDTVPELSQEESLQLLKKFAQLQKS
ncbi:hypothetical protein BLNAU_7361 [Blattamonas nauphoetae]|uniref:Uncharacterized protein n=1 Tax=Blattamonas nauphoetae TaxID=2049346 RepID=A0ABQ9Y1T7_9EUKA|nr:hypothetical protein BLNAU_7361 [Blattamonas nauphoetae]